MGTGASAVRPSSCFTSNVNELAHNSENRSSNQQLEEPLSQRSLKEQLERCQRCLTMAEENCEATAKEAGRLERLVVDLEGQNLDLNDRIKTLEQRLFDKDRSPGSHRVLDDSDASDDEEEQQRPFFRHTQRRLSSTSPRSVLTETLQAKDTLIKELERQIEENKADMLKQRLRWRRKIKHCSAQLSDCKQTSAMRIMELRQELLRITEDKRKLATHVTSQVESFGETPDPASDPSSSSNSHGLIAELSQQVVDQTERIRRLERSIAERDRLIKQLEHKIAQSRPTQNSSPRQSQPQLEKTQPSPFTDSHRQASAGGGRDSGLESDGPPVDNAVSNHAHGSLPTLTERDVTPRPTRHISVETHSVASSDITEDCNLDAESLDDSDDEFPSPVLSAHNRPKSAHYSAGRPKVNH